MRIKRLPQLLTMLLGFLALSLAMAVPARAEVDVSFQSFNGSLLGGRYPHTFVIFDGTLADGTRVDENWGFSAKRSSAAIMSGQAEHIFMHEDADQIRKTNRHFTVTVSDAKFREMRAEIDRWRNSTEKLYSLDNNNCIHFVAKMAQMVGLKADVPREYVKKPRAWLNYVTRNNPRLGAREIG